jgi:hypothetical protein
MQTFSKRKSHISLNSLIIDNQNFFLANFIGYLSRATIPNLNKILIIWENILALSIEMLKSRLDLHDSQKIERLF